MLWVSSAYQYGAGFVDDKDVSTYLPLKYTVYRRFVSCNTIVSLIA